MSTTGFKSLDALAKGIESLSGTWEVTITPARNTRAGEASNAEKLYHLKMGGRNFLKVTPAMQAAAFAMLKESISALVKRGLPVGRAPRAIGEAVIDHIAERFMHAGSNGPPDVAMKPLSPEWILRKGHSRIGTLTGHLRQSIVDAKVTTKRISK